MCAHVRIPSGSTTHFMRVDQRRQIGDSGRTRVSTDSCVEGGVGGVLRTKR